MPSTIKIADVLISDDLVGVNSLSLSGTDAALFELIGTELYLRAGVVLDAEARSALSVSVDVDDAIVGSTPDDSAVGLLQIANVEELPVLVSLPATPISASDICSARSELHRNDAPEVCFSEDTVLPERFWKPVEKF